MSINETYQIFKEYEGIFQCPICGKGLKLTKGGSFLCKKKHCFDLSAKDYINFVPNQNQRQMSYDKTLFENRGKIFADGFYEDVLKAAGELIEHYAQPSPRGGRLEKESAGGSEHELGQEPGRIRLLDAGCGEGYYSRRLCQGTGYVGQTGSLDIFAMDIVRDAIALAARTSREETCGAEPSGAGSVKWMVGDLTRIPLGSRVMDVILDVLTPANYGEFMRVLAVDGILIKVIPGNSYLQEIRSCVSEQLFSKEYSNENVVEYFEEHMELLEHKKVCSQHELTPEQAECFLRMTPMTFGIELEQVDRSRLDRITIDMELLVGRKRRR